MHKTAEPFIKKEKGIDMLSEASNKKKKSKYGLKKAIKNSITTQAQVLCQKRQVKRHVL